MEQTILQLPTRIVYFNTHECVRIFLSRLSLASAAIGLPHYGFSWPGKADEFVEADTTCGRIKGIRKDGVNLFI